ncbi:MAG: hypothetical protein RLZZ102_398 [Pseudomonadota bacterium]|jgi:hypothetical protein
MSFINDINLLINDIFIENNDYFCYYIIVKYIQNEKMDIGISKYNNFETNDIESSDDIIFNSTWINNLFDILEKEEKIFIYVCVENVKDIYIHSLNEKDSLHYGLFIKVNKWHLINKIMSYKDLIWENASFKNIITHVNIDKKFNNFIQSYIYSSKYIQYFNRVKKPLKNHIYLKSGFWNINESRFENYKDSLIYNFILSKAYYDLKDFSYDDMPIFKRMMQSWFNTTDLNDKIIQVFLAALSLMYHNLFLQTKTILIVQGISGAGKSLLGKMIQALIGVDMISAININELTRNQFSKTVLVNKKGIILNDANELISMQCQELLKGLSGSDTYNYEMKFSNERELIVWSGFILIISNHEIEFSDHIGDLPDRKLTFNFNKKLDLKEFEVKEPVLSIGISELSNGKTFYNFSGALTKEIPMIASLLIKNFSEKENKKCIKNYKDYLISFKVDDNNILNNFLKNYVVFKKDAKIHFGGVNRLNKLNFDEETMNFKNKNINDIEEKETIGLFTLYTIHCLNQNINKTPTRNRFKDLVKTFISQQKNYAEMKVVKDSRGFFTLKNATYKDIDQLREEVQNISYDQYIKSLNQNETILKKDKNLSVDDKKKSVKTTKTQEEMEIEIKIKIDEKNKLNNYIISIRADNYLYELAEKGDEEAQRTLENLILYEEDLQALEIVINSLRKSYKRKYGKSIELN